MALVTLLCVAAMVATFWARRIPANAYKAQQALETFMNTEPPPMVLVDIGNLKTIEDDEINGMRIYRVGNIEVDLNEMSYSCKNMMGPYTEAYCGGRFKIDKDGSWSVVDHDSGASHGTPAL